MINAKGTKIRFKTKLHEEGYILMLCKCERINCETKSVMYLLSLVCRNMHQAEDCFNFKESNILLKGLNESWQTGESIRAVKLAFNLWNGRDDNSTVYSLFGTSLDKYFIEAIKLRFDI